MTRIAIATAITLGTLGLPGTAAAHPDHFSGGSFGIAHYLTDPFHLTVTLAAASLYFALRRLVVRRRAAQRIGR